VKTLEDAVARQQTQIAAIEKQLAEAKQQVQDIRGEGHRGRQRSKALRTQPDRHEQAKNGRRDRIEAGFSARARIGNRETTMASLPNPKTSVTKSGCACPKWMMRSKKWSRVNTNHAASQTEAYAIMARLYDAIRSQIDQKTTVAYPAGVGVIVAKAPLTSRFPISPMFDAATMVET